jgi:hypothetical protein
MKKLFIGLLLAAAGGATFFLLNQKKKTNTGIEINKELIIGKWKPVIADSIQPHYQYDFRKEGIALRAANDTVKADTTHYEWNKKNELVLKVNAIDTAGTTFAVVQLSADSLQLQTEKTKSPLLFTKVK